jgi:hypothetical protein
VTRVPVVTDDSRTFWRLVRDTIDRTPNDPAVRVDYQPGTTLPAFVTTRLGVRFDWIRS